MGRAKRDGHPPRPLAWCLGVLCCAVLAASPASRPLSIEQKLLLIAWPASCAWQLCHRAGKDQEKVTTPWPAKLLQLMTAFSGASFCAKLVKDWEASATAVLPCASLLSLAHMTLPSLELPLGDFIPWWSLLVLGMIATFGSSDMRAEAGLSLGRMDGAPLLWSAICVAISTVALVGWSKIWVRGNHGPIQDALAPLMSPVSVLPLAVVNAFREELQFRMMFLGAVLAGDASDSKLLTTISVALHSTFFALLHYLGGFPRGLSGFVLVLVWSSFLDILRIWSGGMALVFLLHVQADVTIFLLVHVEDRRRRRLNQTD